MVPIELQCIKCLYRDQLQPTSWCEIFFRCDEDQLVTSGCFLIIPVQNNKELYCLKSCCKVQACDQNVFLRLKCIYTCNTCYNTCKVKQNLALFLLMITVLPFTWSLFFLPNYYPCIPNRHLYNFFY